MYKSRVTIGILILIIAISVLFPFITKRIGYPIFTDILVRDVAVDAMRFGSHITDVLLEDSSELDYRLFTKSFAQKEKLLRRDYKVSKLHILSRDAAVLYSSDPSDFGTLLDEDYIKDQHRKGTPFSRLTWEAKETPEGKVIKSETVRSYIPIVRKGKYIGAYEIYTNVTSRRETLYDIVKISNLVLYILEVILLGGILMINLMVGRSEAALKEKIKKDKERLEVILSSLGEGVFGVDREGRVTFINPAGEKLLGWPENEMIGRQIHDFIKVSSPEDAEEADADKNPILNVLNTGRPYVNIRETFRRNDGTFFPVSFIARTAIEEGEINGAVVSFHDITDRILAEEELQKVKEAAIDASAAKSEFLANMSHEIRTPMNAIIGMTELALDTDLTDEQSEYLRIVESNSQSLLFLINDILDISKIESGNAELEHITFDLQELVEAVTIALRVRARGKELDIVHYVAPDVPIVIIGDPDRLRQVLINLLDNAIKFTEKGEVAIRIENDSQMPTGSNGEAQVHFSVSDTGIGIAREHQAKIFDKFIQAGRSTSRKYKGTGLGLSICKSLVKLMGGEMWLESEKGRGSTFHFRLAMQYKEDRRNRMRKYLYTDLEGVTALAVQDNRTTGMVLEKELRTWDIDVDTVQSGKDALEIMSSDVKKYNLAVIDCDLKGMPAVEVVQHIRRNVHLQDIKILLLSSPGFSGYELKVDGLITKPVTQPALLSALMNAFRIGTGRNNVIVDENKSAGETRSKPGNVLLVEDYPDNQNYGRRILEKDGFCVDVAESGEEAVEAFEKVCYDVILMDINLPGMNGFEATGQIRSIEKKRNSKRTPVIALTAHAIKGYRKKCLEHGMDDYVTKPINSKALIKAIDKCINTPAVVDRQQSLSAENIEPVTGPAVEGAFVDSANMDGKNAPVQADEHSDTEEIVYVDAEIEDLIPEFIENRKKDVGIIQELLKEREYSKIQRIGHNIKGTSGNYGFLKLGSIGAAIEASAKKNDGMEITKLNNRLCEHIISVKITSAG